MIGRLEGRLLQVRPGEVIIDSSGVGYLVATTLRAYQSLAGEDRATLWIHSLIRDDSFVLFGFPDRDELETFRRLIGVAGVGPRTALAVLSGLTPARLAAAVDAGDPAPLERAPGVGRKTAQRILLELKGRLVGTDAEAGPRDDAVSALVNLGYSQRDSGRAVDAVLADDVTDLAEILRLALQRLNR